MLIPPQELQLSQNKPFPGVSQVLLNGRLLQSIAADRTVCYGGLYGLP